MPQLDLISLFPIVLGVLLLTVGRKFFWLFIGAVAFFAAMNVVPRFAEVTASRVFYISLAVGAAAAVAGSFLSKIAVRIAGFASGGFVFFNLWEEFASTQPLPWWLPFVAGGILGTILLSFLVDWTLIVLSSLTGAFLITEGLHLNSDLHIGVLVILSVIGIVAQAKMKGRKGKQGT